MNSIKKPAAIQKQSCISNPYIHDVTAKAKQLMISLNITMMMVFCSALTKAQSSTVAPFNSPQVNPDNTVLFRYLAPQAKEVKLNVQFEKSAARMIRDSMGIWSVTLGPAKPDIYPYCFVIDGIQVADPRNTSIFPNEGFQNSLVEIIADTPQLHTISQVPHGTLSYRYYSSPELGTRPVIVYTPPGYEENLTTRYPVLFLLHGTTDTEETWTKVGRANIILDNLIARRQAVPMIVVMPYGRAYPLIGKTSGSLRNRNNLLEFTKDFLNNLLPFTEKNYRIKKGKDNRAIAGFSGGGGQALYIGLNNPELFSWVAGFAPGMLKEEFEMNNAVAFANPGLTNQRLKMFWIGVGKEDGLFPVISDYLKLLDEKKIRYETLVSDGGHTWMNCKLFLGTLARKLFK